MSWAMCSPSPEDLIVQVERYLRTLVIILQSDKNFNGSKVPRVPDPRK